MLTLKDDSDWRKHRDSQDLRTNLSMLENPDSYHERAACKSSDLDDVNLEKLPSQIANNNNFE